MIINWTNSAEKDLLKIYKFYKKTVSEKIAQQIVSEIIQATDRLKLGLFLGQQEELLKQFNQGHRYLISNHTKIIYLPFDNHVIITHVFDTRKPKKLK